MSFTKEHIAILEKHAHHHNTLKTSGYMRFLDRIVFDALQLVYNEAIGPQRFTQWCGECVADLVRHLYAAYYAWQDANPPVTAVLTVEEDTDAAEDLEDTEDTDAADLISDIPQCEIEDEIIDTPGKTVGNVQQKKTGKSGGGKPCTG
jgi:hypothetical protein